ncbi:hypothetical protein EYR36_001641 [Pleurotus pulmonarius]|nr:hypothetical protein EYR36_008415 [Pleurotus pulmonarius]KAF4579821.1 hypothetical protein EYR36_001641 [Pleurotus pulmonarius]
MSEETPETPKAPFDKKTESTDVILRSSDGLEFHAHKLVLSLASPFFKDMFTLPRRRDAEVQETEEDSAVDMEESSGVLDWLLRFCYPVDEPPLDDVKLALDLLSATIKYDMDGPTSRVKRIIMSTSVIAENPLLIYSTSCKLGLADEAKLAAKISLRYPMLTLGTQGLQNLPALAYHRFLVYHQKCSMVASELVCKADWLPTDTWDFSRLFVQGTCNSPCCAGVYWGGVSTRKWIGDYMNQVRERLRMRPSPLVVYEEETLAHSLKLAGRCILCGPTAHQNLSRFAKELLAPVVEAALEKASWFRWEEIVRSLLCHILD